MTKIIQLNAENVKVLKAIEIKPDQNIIELTGKNGQGKSSVIDSIIMGILGKKYQPEKPVREGESEANISINIGNLIIKRKIKADGSSTLRVENTEGASYGSPQAMLDELVSNISFDPLQFSKAMSSDNNKQLKVVLIKDGSLLDEDNMKIITDMAEEKDYQAWIEKVDSSGKIGIVIEDGEIKAINKGE